MELTAELSAEYERLFASCKVTREQVAAIDKIADRAVRHKAKYESVAELTGTPWFVIATIHNLEAGQRFTTHLHNGDPLTARTVHVPVNRPRTKQPPFTWEFSATDALKSHGFHKITAWTVPVILFQLEKYNGFGYRRHHPEVLSPYLWSFTNHYTKGKFVADGKFSSTAVSKQCGGVALLRRMVSRKDIALGGQTVRAMTATLPKPVKAAATIPPFPGVALARGVSRGPDVCRVQERLRVLGFSIDKVAGCPFGPQTEKAVKAFQAKHGLRQSGRVGRDTWKAIFS